MYLCFRPYTPSLGQYSNVWYDRAEISPEAPDESSIDQTAAALGELIKTEADEGITENNIVVGKYTDMLYTVDRNNKTNLVAAKTSLKDQGGTVLILTKTTNFRLFQTERVCRRQFQIG